jgi:hypothetical protein
MMRLFQPRLALDLALLSALELALLFFAFNHLVCASGCLPGAPALTQATVFTLTLGLSGIIVGLYRPTLYLQSGHLPLIRLAMAASVASLCGFVAIWASPVRWDGKPVSCWVTRRLRLPAARASGCGPR